MYVFLEGVIKMSIDNNLIDYVFIAFAIRRLLTYKSDL